MIEMRNAGRRLRPHWQRQAQRGAGSLIVVMVLFFLMSLVAAYAGRNMIFEQRTSANQYRSTQAMEAAEGGVEWALAMLNGGLINASCTSTGGTTNFRTRMLDIDASTGAIVPKIPLAGPGTRQLRAYCVSVPGNAGTNATNPWDCECPDVNSTWGVHTVSAPTAPGPAPAFKVTFYSPVGSRSNVVQLISQGCTKLDYTSRGCLINSDADSPSDALAVVNVLVAIKGAISAAPLAALTARQQINLTGSSAATLANQDAASYGITVDAGGSISLPPGSNLLGLTGAPPDETKRDNDSSLPSTPDSMFASVFGMRRDTYKEQPAAIVLTCPASCTASILQGVAQRNPGRIIWLEGDATLSAGTSTDIGSATAPVVIVSRGQLTKNPASPPIRIFGLVYQFDDRTGSSNLGQWAMAGDLYVQGATVAEGNITGTGNPTLVYDLGILNNLRLTGGSFVRVPGGWMDNN